MKTDLIARVRVHIEQADEMAPSLDELIAGFESGPIRRTAVGAPVRRRALRGWVVAVGSAAGVLALFAGFAWLTRSTEGTGPATTPPPQVTTTGPDTTTPPTTAATSSTFAATSTIEGTPTTVGSPPVAPPAPPSAAVPAEEWAPIVLDSGLFPPEASVWHATWGGPGVVLLGNIDNADGTETPVAWTSADGVSWDRAVVDPGPGVELWDVTPGGPGLVAVGIADGADGFREAAVWTTADGLRWSRVPHDEDVFGVFDGGFSFLDRVAAGPSGVVALGGACPDAQPCGVAFPVIWTSPDGMTWTSRAGGDELVGVEVNGLAATPQGYVAGGCVLDGDPRIEIARCNATIVTSADGLSWTRVPHDDGVFGGPGSEEFVEAIAVGDTGILVAGYAASGPQPYSEGLVPTGWFSAAGTGGWLRLPDGALPHEVDDLLTDAVAGGPGFVAVGQTQPDHHAIVWISADGLEWTRFSGAQLGDDFAQSGLDHVTVGGPGIIAVGWSSPTQSGGDSRITLWVTAPP